MHKKGIHEKMQSNDSSLQKTEVRIAPIPSPEDLQRYEAIRPGFADRIIKMAEKEQIDRNKRTDRELELMGKVNKRDFRLTK